MSNAYDQLFKQPPPSATVKSQIKEADEQGDGGTQIRNSCRRQRRISPWRQQVGRGVLILQQEAEGGVEQGIQVGSGLPFGIPIRRAYGCLCGRGRRMEVNLVTQKEYQRAYDVYTDDLMNKAKQEIV